MKPKHVRIEELRNQVSEIRHEIAKMKAENALWDGWLSPLEGSLTTWLMAAYASKEEIEKHYIKWGKD